MKKQETNLQGQIAVECTDIAILYPCTVGKFMNLHDGGIVSIGIKGTPDLIGFRKSDGKSVFLECKTEEGYLSPKQKQFKESIGEKYPIIYGVPRSVEDARRIILEE